MLKKLFIPDYFTVCSQGTKFEVDCWNFDEQIWMVSDRGVAHAVVYLGLAIAMGTVAVYDAVTSPPGTPLDLTFTFGGIALVIAILAMGRWGSYQQVWLDPTKNTCTWLMYRYYKRTETVYEHNQVSLSRCDLQWPTKFPLKRYGACLHTERKCLVLKASKKELDIDDYITCLPRAIADLYIPDETIDVEVRIIPFP
jgi:hypothetical protein